MHGALRFLKGFLADKDVASIAPTSAFGVRKICSFLDFRQPLTIVELGPGTGPVTRGLLDRMHEDSRLFAIEKNADFVKHLSSEIIDPRLIVIEEDARNMKETLRNRGIETVDHVISGIPLSFFSAEERQRLFRDAADLLKPHGNLILYQIRDILQKELSEIFHSVRVTQEPLNIPPLTIIEAVKN